MYEIWYKLQHRTFSIHEVEVAKSSSSSVWLVSRTPFEGHNDIIKAVKRETYYETFFKDKKEAIDKLKNLISKKIEKLEEELADLKEGGNYFPLQKIQKRPFDPELLV